MHGVVGRPTVSARRALAAAGVAIALIAAGCGSDSSSSGAGSAEASAKSKKHVTIAIAMTQNSVPYYQTSQLGAEAAGPIEGNAKVVVQGPADPLGGAVAKVAQNLATSLHPDGFGVNPCLLTQWTRIMNLLSRTVPNENVVAWNCKPALDVEGAKKSPVKTFVGANDFQTGLEATKAAIAAAHLGPDTTGTALLAECAEGIPILTARRAGAAKAIRQLLPKVKPVTWVSNAYNSKALVAWTSQLTKYSDVVYASGACDQDSAALATLKARGSMRDVAVAVIDPTAQQVGQIEKGEISAGVGTTPWVIANVATRLLIRHARGEPLPTGWIDTGVHPITKANANQWLKAAKSVAQAKAFFAPIADKVMNQLQANTHPMADAFAG